MSIISMAQIKKSFGESEFKTEVLKGIDLEIEKGEFVAIVGRSGSGKSTLMNILGGLEAPSYGLVKIDGIDIYTMKEKRLNQLRQEKIGYIFQAYHLIPVLTVKENIELPQIKADSKYVDAILDMLELRDKSNILPNKLSGGQQQRVAIARALVNNPSVIIADEPTGNLDSKSEEIVINILKKCIKQLGTTIVMVTHNLYIAKQADRIIEIQDGVILNEN